MPLLDAKPALPSEEDLEFRAPVDELRAKKEVAFGSPLDRERWQILAQAKPGDVLHIRGRRGTESLTFHNVLERGEKFVFLAAKNNHKVYRFTLTSLIVPGASPLR